MHLIYIVVGVLCEEYAAGTAFLAGCRAHLAHASADERSVADHVAQPGIRREVVEDGVKVYVLYVEILVGGNGRVLAVDAEVGIAGEVGRAHLLVAVDVEESHGEVAAGAGVGDVGPEPFAEISEHLVSGASDADHDVVCHIVIICCLLRMDMSPGVDK